MGNILLRNILKNNGVYYPNIPFIPTNPNSDKVLNATTRTVTQSTNYYPFGLAITTTGTSKNKYLYNGKEIQPSNGYYDYGARMYDASVGRWFVIDAMGEKHKQLSAYSYTNNNPIKYIDPDGNDWFWYSKDGKSDPTWNWQERKEYKTGVKDNKGNEVVLKGKEAVVEFKGSKDEKLGKDGKLTGENANVASVTIYGIGGKDDIKTYNGLTVTSDQNKYSMVKEGDYNLSQEQMVTSPYGQGSLTYRVRQLDGNEKIPIENNEINKVTGKNYLSSIFFHRTNWDGYAKYSSQGCIIIDGRQWKSVEKQLGKSTNILLRIIR